MVNIMATEKNTPVGKDSGVVTHKVIVETKFGTFSISLFSNNAAHQRLATKAEIAGFSEKFIKGLTECRIVVAGDDAKAPSAVDNYFD